MTLSISLFYKCLSWLVAIFFLFIIVEPLFANTQQQLAQLEASSGGRLGVAAIDTANNTRVLYRAEERFPFCSTFKVMGVAAILKQSMNNQSLLQQKIIYTKNDATTYSPITGQHFTDGMTISDLCAAAIIYSDSTAINLLIKKLGGLQAVNAFARSVGDSTFRLDRYEPQLNTAFPGDMRDTTTPIAMENSLQRLAFGNTLALPQRKQLLTWLKGCATGHSRIRAGVPKNWVVGDKTGGSTNYGVTNDIGIIWPPKCAPIVVTIYFTQNKKESSYQEHIVAAATRILIQALAQSDSCIRKNLEGEKSLMPHYISADNFYYQRRGVLWRISRETHH